MSTASPTTLEGTSSPSLRTPLPLPISSPPTPISQPTSIQGQTSRPPSPSIDDISGFPRINTGCEIDSKDDEEFNTAAYPYPNSNATPTASPDLKTNEDPFAAQGKEFTFAAKDRDGEGDVEGEDDMTEEQGPKAQRENAKRERALSDGTASKSQTRSSSQKHKGSKGSLSRDGDASKTNERESKHHSTHSSHFEKGWARMIGRRSSKGEKD
ncbi:uncharacterized protein RAG0_12439 [Rhynchosporium agropyri]|uniref:Uncharacterized protein n=1 Tax=Rhynchosporium agropyri TaxID=914238 RepID=A0A1E1L8F0_9HELO|nr:uncharacterized protein RAG0_12439 [Rhynchosporium agropyri]